MSHAHFPDSIRLADAGLRGGTRVFRLDHHIRYVSSKGTITVPTGFVTDGAIFKEAMFNIGIDWPRREIIYRAVRLFGHPAFKKPAPRA